jgi:hypothetical protein
LLVAKGLVSSKQGNLANKKCLYQKFITVTGERVAVNHEPWTEADEAKLQALRAEPIDLAERHTVDS